MEDIKELFKELTEELEKDCSGWDVAPDTEADKTFKEKMITLVKDKYGTERHGKTMHRSAVNDYTRIFLPFSIT